jgi:hypothetical protein
MAQLDRPPTQRDLGMIAVAGAIAEAYWEGHTFDDITEEYFWENEYIMSDVLTGHAQDVWLDAQQTNS